MLLWVRKKQLMSRQGVKIKQNPFFFTLTVQWEYLGRGLKVCCLRDKGTEHRERKQVYEGLAGTCCRMLNKECCFKLLPWAMCLRLGSSW